MNIGYKIKKIRELKNYTQAYVAHSLDISQSYYNKIENGQSKLTVDRLLAITEIFEIEVGVLLNFDEGRFFNAKVG